MLNLHWNSTIEIDFEYCYASYFLLMILKIKEHELSFCMTSGPQDHGWCVGYTCQRRLSLFHSIVALNKSYEVYFTGTSPQNLRLMLLNVEHTRVRQDENVIVKLLWLIYLHMFLSAKDYISFSVLALSALLYFEGLI